MILKANTERSKQNKIKKQKQRLEIYKRTLRNANLLRLRFLEMTNNITVFTHVNNTHFSVLQSLELKHSCFCYKLSFVGCLPILAIVHFKQTDFPEIVTRCQSGNYGSSSAQHIRHHYLQIKTML